MPENRTISVDIPALLRAHDARVTELLEANSREVERRRAAEARVAELEVELQRARCLPLYVPGGRFGTGQTAPDLYDPHAIVRGTVDPRLMPRNDVALSAECLAEDQAEWNKEQRW